MFTVLSNPRNARLYLMIALAVTLVVILSLAILPSIAAPKLAVIPLTGISETASDFYQRHPELRVSAGMSIDMTDYFIRHPELHAPLPSIELSDYFLRHPELRSK